MRRLHRMFVACAIALVVPALQAQEDVAPLQGRWVVTAGEHNGKPMDSIVGGVMTVAGNGFEIRTASGNVLKGTLRLDTSRRPLHMDMIHADGVEWEAIYEVTGNRLRLNYVEKGGKDPRPTAFTTSATTEESIVVLRREAK
jgi:uncharacterized protein (TIGR03067 family)